MTRFQSPTNNDDNLISTEYNVQQSLINEAIQSILIQIQQQEQQYRIMI